MAALDQVGMADRADIRIRDLSGGQFQRVLIARALALEPEVLLLDEPTNGMDLESEHALMELIASFHDKRGLTVVMVSHLLNVVVNYVRSLALLGAEGLISGPLDEVLTVGNLERLYGTGVTIGTLDGRRLVLPCHERHGAP
jgi:ABC-type Mn2+/Zn2+ transport system ATPase subunit